MKVEYGCLSSDDRIFVCTAQIETHRTMASRKHRYAVDPSLVSRPDPVQQPSYGQVPQYDQQQGYGLQPGYGQPQQYAQQAPPQGGYDVQQPRERIWAEDLIPPPAPFVPASTPPPADVYQNSHTPLPPANHIPQPPHAAGPSLRGPKPRLDPSQVPSAVDAAEMDQNLYDQEDFESCNTKGLVPLGTTDYRGVDQGESSLRSRLKMLIV
jgi:protein transport protein SEC24